MRVVLVLSAVALFLLAVAYDMTVEAELQEFSCVTVEENPQPYRMTDWLCSDGTTRRAVFVPGT
jgi:hypothetical protein